MKKTFKAKPLAIIVTFLAFILLIGLGSWQVQRLGEKTALLGKIAKRMHGTSVPMPEEIKNIKKWEFRIVALAGSFDFNNEFLIKPRTLDGVNGYHMFVPFRRISGGIVMVNRGWISDDLMSKAYRPARIVRLEGIIQIPRKTSFTPKNNPDKDDWYWADIKAMAHKANLKNVAPVVITIPKQHIGIYPAGVEVTANINNNHKYYAIFWYTMSLILLVVFVLSSIKTEEAEDEVIPKT